jgi:hypothetical protein
MTRLLTVSNEVLNVSSKRMLGPELLAIIEKIQTDVRERGEPNPYDLVRMNECVLKNTGLRVNTQVVNNPAVNAAMMVYSFHGHSGVTFFGKRAKPASIAGKAVDYKLNSISIDLNAGYVKGDLVEALKFNMMLTTGLFVKGRVELTPEEITAIVLHELGHAFNVFATLADYVYLNYLLSEGVEVLLGKKPNKYRLEVLNDSYIQNAITDPALREKIKAHPTEENLRRALLEAHVKSPRHYLHSTDQKSSIKRDEQLADLFVSRMGFARALVTGLDKNMRQQGGSYTRGNVSFAVVEAIKVASVVGSVALLPILPPAGVFFALTTLVLSNKESGSYDNPTERLTKVRKDLLAQLKQFDKEPQMRDSISADIELLDTLLVDYNQYRTAFEVFAHFVSGSARRKHQLQAQEETLERLLNNDLFLHAHRISKLNTSEA